MYYTCPYCTVQTYFQLLCMSGSYCRIDNKIDLTCNIFKTLLMHGISTLSLTPTVFSGRLSVTSIVLYLPHLNVSMLLFLLLLLCINTVRVNWSESLHAITKRKASMIRAATVTFIISSSVIFLIYPLVLYKIAKTAITIRATTNYYFNYRLICRLSYRSIDWLFDL